MPFILMIWLKGQYHKIFDISFFFKKLYVGPKVYIYKQAKTVSRFFVFLKYLQISTKFNYALC